jgi:hypothetical protein
MLLGNCHQSKICSSWSCASKASHSIWGKLIVRLNSCLKVLLGNSFKVGCVRNRLAWVLMQYLLDRLKRLSLLIRFNWFLILFNCLGLHLLLNLFGLLVYVFFTLLLNRRLNWLFLYILLLIQDCKWLYVDLLVRYVINWCLSTFG